MMNTLLMNFFDNSDNNMMLQTTTTTVLGVEEWDGDYDQTSRFLLEDNNETAQDNIDKTSVRAVLSSVLTNFFLFFLIFGLSATVDCKHLRAQLQNKFAIATGVAMQFLIMPALGYVAVTLFSSMASGSGFTEAMGITLLVVTASPGGSYSNWWCSTFNADLALSVAMTTVSSLLSIGLLPANLFIYTYLAYGKAENDEGQNIIKALDFHTIFFTLAIVLLAILIGLGMGYKYDTQRFHISCNRIGSICGICLILFSVFLSSGADDTEAKAWNQNWSFYVAVAFPCLLGIALSNIIARSVNLSPPETVAISIECCYQNTGIATSVAITMFSNKEHRAQAVAVPLFYGVVEAVVIGCYCLYAWKAGWTKAPKEEKFCVVVSKTYEVEEEDPISDSDDELDNMEGQDTFDDSNDAVVGPPLPSPPPPRRVGFFRRLFFRGEDHKHKRNRKNSDSEDVLTSSSKSEKDHQPHRKRMVSDFTTETMSVVSDISPTVRRLSEDVVGDLTEVDNVVQNIIDVDGNNNENHVVRNMTIPEASSEGEFDDDSITDDFEGKA